MSRWTMRWVATVLALAACTARNPAYLAGTADAAGEIDAEGAPASDLRAPDSTGPAPDPASATPDAAAPVPDVAAAVPDLAGPDLPRSMPDAAASGLLGAYFNGGNFDTLALMRVDDKVDFAWANDPPDPRVNFANFTVRWTGRIRPAYSETYTFTTHSGDGARLWIGSKLVIDDWRLQAPEDHSGMTDLVGGRLYDVKIEYMHQTGWSVMRVSWASPSQKSGVVPTTAYLPP